MKHDFAKTPSFTVATAAVEINVSPDVIRSLIRSGELKAFNVGLGQAKKCWRISASDLEHFIRLRSNQAPTERALSKKKPKPQIIEFY